MKNKSLKAWFGTILIFCSYLLAIYVWFCSLINTYNVFGPIWAIIGILLAGIGLYFMNLIALLLTHQWLILLIYIILGIVVFGIRFLGIYIINNKDKTIEWESYIEKLPDNNKNEFIRLIRDFLIIDNIKPESFYANYQILKNGSRELCRLEAKLHDEIDVSYLGTKSIDALANPLDRPIGLPKWFIAGYPDIVNWFKNSPEDKLGEVFDDLSEDSFLNDDNKISNEHLRKVVDFYKKDNNLECI